VTYSITPMTSTKEERRCYEASRTFAPQGPKPAAKKAEGQGE
jgi:hypothetical protein